MSSWLCFYGYRFHSMNCLIFYSFHSPLQLTMVERLILFHAFHYMWRKSRTISFLPISAAPSVNGVAELGPLFFLTLTIIAWSMAWIRDVVFSKRNGSFPFFSLTSSAWATQLLPSMIIRLYFPSSYGRHILFVFNQLEDSSYYERFSEF